MACPLYASAGSTTFNIKSQLACAMLVLHANCGKKNHQGRVSMLVVHVVQETNPSTFWLVSIYEKYGRCQRGWQISRAGLFAPINQLYPPGAHRRQWAFSLGLGLHLVRGEPHGRHVLRVHASKTVWLA